MASVTDLMGFINSSPSGDKFWSDSEWENELSRAVPDWRSMIADPQNWDVIKGVTPLRAANALFRVFVRVGGLELGKRWFNSDMADQRYAAQKWLTQDAAIDVSLWRALDRSMKDRLLEHRFDRFPGEPFKMLEEYRFEIRRVDLSAAIRSLPHILGYVPSTQIENLRSVIEDADDQVYLARINEMIARREKACQVMSSQQQHQVPYSPNSNERELIARVMEITRRSGYLPAALPPIFISYETPPIFIAYPELEANDEDDYQENREKRRDENEYQIPRNRERRRPETISIEELLGVYQSEHQQIIIYERGIKWLGSRLDGEWLFSVVLIHEIGHWITHVLPKPGVPAWSTDLFALSETDLKEGWAQLITWWIAKQVGGAFRDTFEKLNRNQSSPYHVFEQFKNEPIDEVMASLERLRFLSWPARLQDWKRTLI